MTHLAPEGSWSEGRTHCTDCVQAMSELPTESVDCVLADPPFNLRNGGRLLQHGRLARTDEMAWDEIDNAPWLSAALRILRPSGTLFVFGTWHNLFDVGVRLMAAGARILNTITLVKENGFAVSHRILYERTLYVIWASPSGHGWHFDYAGMRREQGRQLSNVWPYTPPARRTHPCQKNLGVVERMLRMATRPGDLVVDPFAGSGTTAEACFRLGRRYIGFEQLPLYADRANARVAQAAWAPAFAQSTRIASEAPPTLELERGKAG